MELEPRFALATFGERESPEDAFVSSRHASPEAMPAGSVVGTSSLRRECQLRRAFPALIFRPLRGNVNTRLAKLDAGEYDAIILAITGLRRLGLGERIRATVPRALAVPAIGQGILAIEHLAVRPEVGALLEPFTHGPTAIAAAAERAVGRVVEGSCEVPVGALATVSGDRLAIDAFIGTPDGSCLVRDGIEGEAARAVELGHALGDRLLGQGGRDILDRLVRRSA